MINIIDNKTNYNKVAMHKLLAELEYPRPKYYLASLNELLDRKLIVQPEI